MHTTFKTWIAAMAVFALAAFPACASATTVDANANVKVNICHLTGNSNEPLAHVTTGISALSLLNGLVDLKVLDGGYGNNSGDIISAFTYVDLLGHTHNVAGQNLDVLVNGELGSDLLKNGCVPTPPACPKACGELPEVPSHLWLFAIFGLGLVGAGAYRKMHQN